MLKKYQIYLVDDYKSIKEIKDKKIMNNNIKSVIKKRFWIINYGSTKHLNWVQERTKHFRRRNVMNKYLIKGKLYDPVIFGEEDDDWVGDDENPTCGDCACKLNEQHLNGCDVERCPCCGGQMLSCDCGVKYEMTDEMKKRLPFYIEMQRQANIKEAKEMERLMKKIAKQEKLKKKNQNTEM